MNRERIEKVISGVGSGLIVRAPQLDDILLRGFE
ncbi:MAG: hypothetical protein ACJAQT_001684 [Akkermansiaceae bacterium]|jgi:hypothetical protein